MTTTTEDTPAVTAMLDDLLAAGWSRKALARELGTGATTVGRWLTGDVQPHPRRADEIVRLWQGTGTRHAPRAVVNREWPSTPCEESPWVWDGETPADADYAATRCRTDCPVLAACEQYRRDCRHAGVAVHGVLAGQIPGRPA